MEKKNLKKSKRFLSVSVGFLVVLFYIMAVSACSGTSANRMEVRLEIKNPTAIDFDKYDAIFYTDFTLEWTAKDFTPEESLKTFFVDELSKSIGKGIKHLAAAPADTSEMPANSLLITGKLTLDIKERQKIKEVKDEKGNSKNVFTAIQHWDLTMVLEMKDNNTGKDIFKQDFTEKLNDVDASDTSTKFNFETLFFKMTNRFLLKIKKTKKMERRYLLF